MFLLSKTVTNHLKSNLFSTTVITFFAGCSAFIQISTDNIKGIVDSSLAPYSALPKNDIFIKTGKAEAFMGGSSFTVPVEVTVTDAEVKPDGPTEVRVITPLGWLTKYDHTLAKERAKRSDGDQSKADYSGDYCMPMAGLRSIYTNYWIRPKIRFKGIWDAVIAENGEDPLIARENRTYRRECAEYVEEHPIDNDFLGKLIYDYIFNWLNDKEAKTDETLIAFVKGNKGDEKEERRESTSKTLTPFLQGEEEEKQKESLKCKSSEGAQNQGKKTEEAKWCVAEKVDGNGGNNEFGLSDKGRIKWNNKPNIADKSTTPKSGIFGASKTKGQIATHLELVAGEQARQLQAKEYVKKHQERRKNKLKIEMEEMLLNSQHLDVRKVLQEFRKGFNQQIQQVDTNEISSEEEEDQDDLWEPIDKNPWLEGATKRQLTRESNVEEIGSIFNKYRLLQDNQLLRRKRSPREKDQLKFSVHRSVQLSNIGAIEETQKDEFYGHSFKVIAYEDLAERGIVNPIKIIKGNRLFRARENQEKLLKDFIKHYDEPFYSPSMIPMLRMISRAKFSDNDLPKKQQEEKNGTLREFATIRETLHWWIDYLQYPWRDTWNIPSIKAKEFDPIMFEKLQLWLKEIQHGTWSTNGARIVFNFTAPYKHYLIPKELTKALYISINNFKTIGYIDQPTSNFAIVSPEYARIHNLEPISDEKYKEFRSLVNNLWLTQETWEKAYRKFTETDKETNKKHLVNVGEKQMIIVGIGQTPDLLYPAQSWLNIQPDKNKEALIYVDNYGFNDLKERGTIKYQEQYINVGLPENVLAQGAYARKAYKEKLKKFIDEKMSKYKDYYHITLAGEDEGSDQLYSIRDAYIPTFQSRIGAASYILSSAVYIVVLLLIFILIRKYLQSNLYLFGNFIANGMIKMDVLLNICLFTLFPLAVATSIGFLFSWLMQSPFYSIISSFWYLTAQMNPLGTSNAIYFILKVLAFMVPISYFYSRYTLKDHVSGLLKTTATMKVNKLTLFAYRILYKISAMWKFKSVLVFNTFGQSGILTMTSVIGFLILNFFLHNHGKFLQVSDSEKAVKVHEYELDFETPTQQSGPYDLATYEELGGKVSSTTASSEAPREGGQQERKYFSIAYREPELLSEVWKEYTGTSIADISNSEECKVSSSNKIAKFKGLFCLEKKSSQEESKRKKRSAEKPQEQAQEENKWKIKKASNGKSGSSGKEEGQKYYSGQEAIYKTTENLKEKLDKYPNYWFISSRDQGLSETAMDFFKKKTFMRVLLDLDFEYTTDTGFQKYNIWNQQSKELEKIQPMLQRMDENNYDNFINDLVKSRYGPLFVAKFMQKHDTSQASGQQQSQTQDVSKLLTKQGDIHKGKKTWYFKGSDIGREGQETNQRRTSLTGECWQPIQSLKQPTGTTKWSGNCDRNNGSSAPSNTTTETSSNGNGRNNDEKPFEDGLYHLNSKKVVFFNDAPDVEKDLYVVYNPEFLYLVITAVEEFSKNRDEAIKQGEKFTGTEYTLPIKYVFGGIAHSKDKNGTLNGQEPTFYSSTLKNGGSQKFDPTQTPEGDQTYTWAKGTLSKNGYRDQSKNTRIVGLKQDERGAFYKLYQGNKLLNSKLYESSTSQVSSGESTSYPILINRFAARKHNLREGDIIQFEPENHYTRFTCQLLPTEEPKLTETSAETNKHNCERTQDGKNWINKNIKSHQLKVVGIFDSYYKESYFMSQKDLNTILGLDAEKGFNGIFTPKRVKRVPDQLSVALSSYSVSGIYTTLQQKIGNAAFSNLFRYDSPFYKDKKQIEKSSDEEYYRHKNYKIFETAVSNNSSVGYDSYLKTLNNSQGTSGSASTQSVTSTMSVSQREGQVDSESQKVISRISQAFSDYPNPMGTALLSLMNHSLFGDVVFNNLSDLTNNVSYLVILVIFPILLASLITIVYLLIKDLENVFVTMKLLGFGTKENSMPIIVYLLFLLFLSSFIGSLAVPNILNKYVDILFQSQSILLPLITNHWLMISVFAIMGTIYLFSIFRSYVKIKGIYLPVSIKLLVG